MRAGILVNVTRDDRRRLEAIGAEGSAAAPQGASILGAREE